jgi:hypothetical protein
MNLKEAVAVAKQEINDLFAPVAPQDGRLEEFLYDDDLAVWTLTIGFAFPDQQKVRSYRSSGSLKPTNPFCPSGTR